ncbi:hypothetical protein ACJMK2_023062 [Sinanodonta woodiana]|uniref:DNA 3'-5' helicase n=1 Tax=Sinanodonta woodiana TaxID=1069815 RepID=A0ABD3T4L5_SINWO
MFHSRTDKVSVTRILEDFVKLQGFIRVLICTVAFSIGIQVDDIDVVVHWGIENSVLSYWQEVGRCSRDGRKGYGIWYIFPRSFSRCSDEYMKKLCNTSDCLRSFVLEQFLLSNMDQSSSRMCSQEDCDCCECKACLCCVNCMYRCGCAGKPVNVIDRL